MPHPRRGRTRTRRGPGRRAPFAFLPPFVPKCPGMGATRRQLPPEPASGAADRRGRPPTEATSGPPATYRSATGLIALRRCARGRRPGPGGGGSRSEEKGDSKDDSERHGDQNSLPKPTAPRQPGCPGAAPPPTWSGAGPCCQGRGLPIRGGV